MFTSQAPFKATPKSPELLKEDFAMLRDFVYRGSGIVLGEDKVYLFESRLTPVLRRAHLQSLQDLCRLLRTGGRPELERDVVDAMTTNETLFFRDVSPFEALRDTILPEMLERKRHIRQLRFWSAASSSGQEAYSLAMLLDEMGLSDWNIEILGTDLSENMVRRAQNGRYMQIEVGRGLPAAYLTKYFRPAGTEWEIHSELRRRVAFELFDLRLPMERLGTFDFVFCRNVLIYFDMDTKKRILDRIGGQLNQGGYLMLGAAETTLEITDVFDRRVVCGTSFYSRR